LSQDLPMINYYGATDVGNVRTNNEDVFFICEACHYCLVADGMGGAAAGEVASRIFADTAKAVFAGHDGVSEENTIARVQTTFKLANDKILKHVERNRTIKAWDVPLICWPFVRIALLSATWVILEPTG
jgi:serine/threonine protein phosphatase PrpC